MATQSCKSKSPPERDGKTNWKLCCLCQEKTNEKLVESYDAGYVTLATNNEFYTLNAIPKPFDAKRLNEGDGILKTLEEN